MTVLVSVIVTGLTLSPVVFAVQQIMDQSGQVQLTLPPTELSLTGCAAPNGLVTVFDNNVPAGTVVAEGNGAFSKTLTISSLGLHNIKLHYEDPQSVRSDTSTYNIAIAAFENTNLAVQLLPTVRLNQTSLEEGGQLIFTGYACPNSLFELIIDNSMRLPVTALSDGRWYLTVSTAGYYVGSHTYYLQYPLGQSEPLISQKGVFTISAMDDRGSTPSANSSELMTPRIVSPFDNYLASTPNITVTGTAGPNTQLEVWLNGQLGGSIFVNPLGEWSFSFPMQSSQYSIRARACSGTSCTEFSNEVTVYYYGGFSSCALDFSLREYRFFKVGLDRGLDLGIDVKSGIYPYQILLDWGDEAVENITLATTQSVRYHHVFHNVGLYNGRITIRDSAGCQRSQYFSIEVIRVDSSRWWIVPGAIALSGSWLVSRRLLDLLHRKSGKSKPKTDIESVL